LDNIKQAILEAAFESLGYKPIKKKNGYEYGVPI
jgi:hypothetical protein